MEDESLGWKDGNRREAAERMDAKEKSYSNEGSGSEKVSEDTQKRAEWVGCVRQMGMLEEGKRRVAVGSGRRGGGGG